MAGYNIGAVAAVPEPQTWALLLAGLAMVAALARRRRGGGAAQARPGLKPRL
ncbi:MAG: PEPxxWA-CTERM sorting domain-containing protein [Pseudomonadota bacterium]